MKFIVFTAFICTLNFKSYSQTMEQSIQKMAKDIAHKVSKKHKTFLAMGDFTNNSGNADSLTKYIKQQFEVFLQNSNSKLVIIEREHLNEVKAEHKLKSDGFTNMSTEKFAISFTETEGEVIGNITYINNYVKLFVKIIDVSTTEILASSSCDIVNNPIPKTADVPTVRKNNSTVRKVPKSTDSTAQELPSSTPHQDEAVEHQDRVVEKKEDCLVNNTGDYCFSNKGSFAMQYSQPASVTLINMTNSMDRKTLVIQPGDEQCVYELSSGVYSYYILFQREPPNARTYYSGAGAYNYTGEIKIENCRSKTLSIK